MKSLLKSIAIKAASALGPHRFHRADKNLWVLMYHRILPISDPRYALEEPGMVVTPESFEMQMTEIRKHFDIVDLEDWVELKHQNAPLPRKACAVTFDDGWLDNYEYAFPILERHKIPYTVFVVSEKINTHFNFWPNQITAHVHAGNFGRLKDQKIFSSALNGLEISSDRSLRENAALVINALKVLSEADIYTALKDLPTSAGDESPSRALMNWQEIQAMVDSGLCKIGSHTCSHQRLTKNLASSELSKEILASQAQLTQTLHKPVPLFCYPNGDSTDEAVELVKKTYRAAVTTQRGIASSASTELHLLPRIGLHEDVSDTPSKFGARLSSWL